MTFLTFPILFFRLQPVCITVVSHRWALKRHVVVPWAVFTDGSAAHW
jgi:hypothetical protein